MWARIIEFMLACWLAVSPFVFRFPGDAVFLWAMHFLAALFIAICALSSFRRSLSRLHLVNIIVALWLIGFGFFGSAPPLPGELQNDIFVGLLLGVFAIIPSRSSSPPRTWMEYIEHVESNRDVA